MNTISQCYRIPRPSPCVLTESATNPRRTFRRSALEGVRRKHSQPGRSLSLAGAASQRTSFEIVAGARRYRAAQMAEVATVPVRIVNLTDAEALEAAANREPSARRRAPVRGGAGTTLHTAPRCWFGV